MAALLVAIAGPENLELVPVTRRVLAASAAHFSGRIPDDTRAREAVGDDLVAQSILLEFPDTAAARAWLACTDRQSALTPLEAALLQNAVVVEKAAAPEDLEARRLAKARARSSRGAASAQPAPMLSPTAVALLALILMLGCLAIIPQLGSSFLVEVRFLLALFASCFVLALNGFIVAEARPSRASAAATALLVLAVAAVMTTLMSTPLSTMLASMVDVLRTAAFATPYTK